ncbi:hypothetical protein MNBD_NITROSPIRAE03-1898 [hydrothermal vent metagenome]|uniref:Uncharacterized protein n=1 Tax=hydrothermal vent metagenome TaxID=652676 RepID=A0A3B1DB43_9ZZZZ
MLVIGEKINVLAPAVYESLVSGDFSGSKEHGGIEQYLSGIERG